MDIKQQNGTAGTRADKAAVLKSKEPASGTCITTPHHPQLPGALDCLHLEVAKKAALVPSTSVGSASDYPFPDGIAAAQLTGRCLLASQRLEQCWDKLRLFP